MKNISNKLIPLILIYFLFFCLYSVVLQESANTEEKSSLLFDTSDHGEPGDRAPVIKPWKHIKLDPMYSGWWIVTGDVDCDGEVDIVSSQNVNENDVHYTSTTVAQRLDGSVLWRWGDPDIGRREWHHDVACQIYDWTGDGFDEIILAHARGAFDRHGKRITTFECGDKGMYIQPGDMTGDGVIDVTITTTTSVYIFKNENGVKPLHPVPLGCGINYSLY